MTAMAAEFPRHSRKTRQPFLQSRLCAHVKLPKQSNEHADVQGTEYQMQSAECL